MIACPKCKITNPDDAKFCQGCGGRLIAPSVAPVVHERIEVPNIDVAAIPIKTIVCPHCKKDTLPDFDTCVNCGKSLTQSPNQSFAFQAPPKKGVKLDIPPEEKKEKEAGKKGAKKDAVVDIIEPNSKLDQQWEVITCPACGKKTRKNLGYCLNCKAALTGNLQPIPPNNPEPEAKPIAVPSPAVATLQPEINILPKPVPANSVASNDIVVPPEVASSKPKPMPPPPRRLSLIIPIIFVLFLISVIAITGVLLIKFRHKSVSLAKTISTTEMKPMIPKSDTAAIYSVFDTVRDAMLSKDTELLMSCYSPQFSDYQAKLTDTDELIKTYDIVSLTYAIDSPALKIKGVKAELPIKWNIKLRKYDDGSTLSATDSNYVVLAKENSQWKIKQVLQR